MSDMTKPSFAECPNDLIGMLDSDWYKLVAELAYPERAATMVRVVQLAEARGVQSIVETGCIRGWAGDGQSTLILAMLAVRLGCDFETFDISHEHILQAKKWLGPFEESVRWREQDSVSGLSQIQGGVGLVYLDSYDYDAANPRQCQLHQLAEVGAIYGKLAENAVIVMDDASLDCGGKVAMASDFLKNNGWVEIARDYQLIMSRKSLKNDLSL